MNDSTIEDNRYLLYLDEYQALICKQCECAINGTTNGIARHFRERHKTIPLAERKLLSKFTDEIQVKTPEHLTKPIDSSQRLKGLKLQQGFECQTCLFVCASDTYMIE